MSVLPSKFYNEHKLYFAYFVYTFFYKYQISHERIINRDLMILGLPAVNDLQKVVKFC